MSNESKDMAALTGGFILFVTWAQYVLYGLYSMAWIEASIVATVFAIVATSAVSALASATSGRSRRPGSAAWRNFFRASPRSVVAVVTTPDGLRETMHQLRLGGWTMMTASSAAMGVA